MLLHGEILCKIILMGDEGKLLPCEEALQKICLESNAGLQALPPVERPWWYPSRNIMLHHSCFFSEHSYCEKLNRSESLEINILWIRYA